MDTITAGKAMNLRSALLIACLCAEVLLISLYFDAYQVAIADSAEWFSFLSRAGHLAKILVAVLVFLMVGMWPRLPRHLAMLNESAVAGTSRYYLGAHLASFALLFYCSTLIFEPGIEPGAVSDAVVAAWLVTFPATGILWLLALAPVRYWRWFVDTEHRILAIAVAAGIFAWWLTLQTQSLWTPLSDVTFQVSATLLGLFYTDIVVDPQLKMLGARNFVVNIAPQCSGYEGMALMTMFCGFYLSIFRNEFRFPRALLLVPIGIATIWFFNNLRIALLIAIGASVSPQIAIGGFHSQAGWISFILVSVALLMLAYRSPYFSRARSAQALPAKGITLPMATLIPFIVLLSATILTSALSAGFDWLYPLRVIAVAVAIGAFWRALGLRRPAPAMEAWIAGAAVFVIWILLVPVDADADALFAAELYSGSTAVSIAWLVFRTLGAVVTVPVAEELVFRGYLLARLSRQEVILEGKIEFRWVALIVSSLAFGLLHSNWIAGTAAGLVYGLLRYRGDSVWTAIIAHGCTNLLLSLYVLSTGHWSLW